MKICKTVCPRAIYTPIANLATRCDVKRNSSASSLFVPQFAWRLICAQHKINLKPFKLVQSERALQKTWMELFQGTCKARPECAPRSLGVSVQRSGGRYQCSIWTVAQAFVFVNKPCVPRLLCRGISISCCPSVSDLLGTFGDTTKTILRRQSVVYQLAARKKLIKDVRQLTKKELENLLNSACFDALQ